MFTGLIAEKGKVSRIQRINQSIQLTCTASPKILHDYQIGDSMAINGVCLTATTIKTDQFTVDIMPETFQRSTFSTIKVNNEVNLERAVAFGSRMEGHLLSGHVDTTTRLVDKRELENAIILTFDYPSSLKGEIVSQGSVGLNGVSLTVTKVTARTFSVSLIPHTRHLTNLGDLNRGALVNLETDLIGKYIKENIQHFQGQIRGGY